MSEKVIDRYRKEAECVKRCNQFNEKIEGLEAKFTESFLSFSKEIKTVSDKLEENIEHNKKFQKSCESGLEAVMKKIEKSKKEIKRLKKLNMISVILFILLVSMLYVGF